MKKKLLELLLLELEKFYPSERLVQLKELKDYLSEKNEKGKLDIHEIKFDDIEDKEFFEKLINELGIDFYKIVRDVVS